MKKIAVWLGCILMMLLAVLGVFYLNISSVSRSTIKGDEDDESYVSDPEGNDTVIVDPEGGSQGNNAAGESGESDDTEGSSDDSSILPPNVLAEFLSSLQTIDVVEKDDQSVACYTYTQDSRLVYWGVLAEDATDLGLQEVQTDRVVYSFLAESALLSESTEKEKVKSLSLYGGLLIASTKGKRYILNPKTGKIWAEMDSYLPVYAKDAEGRALFCSLGIYYYFDTDTQAFVKTEKPENFGLYYDNIPVEKTADSLPIPYYDAGKEKWGYRDASGKILIEAKYYRVLPFSENGIAAVQKSRSEGLLFIDTAGKIVLDSHLNYYDYNGNPAYEWFYAPERLTSDALGSVYFSYGYMRVTSVTFSISNSTEVLRTRELLVDKEGNFLSMPGDYTLVAYSDGIAVLEKDGKYGYYSQKGRWIVDPNYTEAMAFSGGIGVVRDQSGKYHAFDTNGNEIIPGVFDYLSAPSMGMILAYRQEDGWMLFSLCESVA